MNIVPEAETRLVVLMFSAAAADSLLPQGDAG